MSRSALVRLSSFLALLIMLATLLSSIQIQAFPIGAGDCPANRPAVGSVHLTASRVETGFLEEHGFRVEINGQILQPNTLLEGGGESNSSNILMLESGVDHTWQISDGSKRQFVGSLRQPRVGFRGFLLRLGNNERNNERIDTTVALSSADENAKEAYAACVLAQGVGGITHRDSTLKSAVSGILRMDQATTTGLQLDVTVVVENSNDSSIYYYSSYTIGFQKVDRNDEFIETPTLASTASATTPSPTIRTTITSYPTVPPANATSTTSPTAKAALEVEQPAVSTIEDPPTQISTISTPNPEEATATPTLPPVLLETIVTNSPTKMLFNQETSLTVEPALAPVTGSSPTQSTLTMEPDVTPLSETSAPTLFSTTDTLTQQPSTMAPEEPTATTAAPTVSVLDAEANKEKDNDDPKEAEETLPPSQSPQTETSQENQLKIVLGSCSPQRPCEMCEGDCNGNDDCMNDLECYRSPGEHSSPIPGCSGVDEPAVDYCYAPSPLTARLRYPFCTNDNPCGLCEGDCNSDNECEEGLLCFQRLYQESTNIPGCQGSGVEGLDYCYNQGEPLVEGECTDDNDCPELPCGEERQQSCNVNVCRDSKCTIRANCGPREFDPSREYCCNKNCRIITVIGGVCNQTDCEACGDNICISGESCCGPCGVCSSPGERCPDICTDPIHQEDGNSNSNTNNDEKEPTSENGYWSIADSKQDADSDRKNEGKLEDGKIDGIDYWTIGNIKRANVDKGKCRFDADCADTLPCKGGPCPFFACRNSACALVEPCGQIECNEFEYCCNESCSICVPFENDTGCTNEFCEAPLGDNPGDSDGNAPDDAECIVDLDCPIFFCAYDPCPLVECLHYKCVLFIRCGQQKCVDDEVCCCGRCDPPNAQCKEEDCAP